MPLDKIVLGHIPERLIYYCQAEQQAHQWWEHFNMEGKVESHRVRPTFVVDADNPKTHATAERWAGNKTQYHTDNFPISGIKVITLEYRGEGGRAYKVMLPGGYYVDLREDVLLDTILHDGIKPGGVLTGDYVWARMASQMRLVRVGSELHRRLAAATTRRGLKPPGKNDLEAGAIYITKGGKHLTFLGYVSTTSFEMKIVSRHWGGNIAPTYTIKRKDIPRMLLWQDISNLSVKTPEKYLMDHLQNDNPWSFKLTNTHTCIEKVGTVTLPPDVVGAVRKQGLQSLADELKYCKPSNLYDRLAAMARHSMMASLGPADQFLPLDPALDAIVKATT